MGVVEAFERETFHQRTVASGCILARHPRTEEIADQDGAAVTVFRARIGVPGTSVV